MSTTLAASNSLADLAARIRAEHQGARAAIKRGIEHALAAGDLLIEAKGQVPHGQWLPWLREHCDNISERTASHYMRLARNRAEIGNVADLTVREAIAALASPVQPEKEHSENPEHASSPSPPDKELLGSASGFPEVERQISIASSSVNRSSTRDLPTPSCAEPEADIDPRAAAIAEGKRLADRLRASSERLSEAVEKFLTGCRDYGKQVNEMPKRERAEFFKGVPPKERRMIRHWCRLANDEHMFRFAVRRAQLETDEITWGLA